LANQTSTFFVDGAGPTIEQVRVRVGRQLNLLARDLERLPDSTELFRQMVTENREHVVKLMKMFDVVADRGQAPRVLAEFLLLEELIPLLAGYVAATSEFV
jgi:hypothetical protein